MQTWMDFPFNPRNVEVAGYEDRHTRTFQSIERIFLRLNSTNFYSNYFECGIKRSRPVECERKKKQYEESLNKN